MIQIRFSWCLVWFLSASVYFSFCLVLAARILSSEKYPRHDENWWFWNQEAKEKPSMFVDTRRKKGEKEIKLEFSRSVHPFAPNVDLLRSLLSKEPLTGRKVKKRWLSGSFGFCGNKKQHQGSRKWLIDSQRSGSNIPTTPVIQDPWMMPHKKMKQIHQGDYETLTPFGKPSAGPRAHSNQKTHRNKMALQHQNTDKHTAVNIDNILFGSSNHTSNNENNLDSTVNRSQQLPRFPEQRMKSYADQRPSSVYQQVWNKSHDPVWDRFMTPFGELKFNPLRQPYPFHDSRSSIKWYTTPRYGLVRTSEPPLKEQEVQNDRRLFSSVENKNGGSDDMKESKGVAKAKDKEAEELTEQKYSEYKLMPKIYALNQFKNGKKSYKKYRNHYGLFADSVTNPIIVPGFNRKLHTDLTLTKAPDDEEVSLRPYIIRTEERNNPFEDEFIQVSRANRNHTKNLLSMNESKQVTVSSIPIQMPSPYAFPGGVNISILVPNPPAPSSHETALSTMTSTSTDKNTKKKKERKKKVKCDDELHDLLSEPRSLVYVRENVRKFPYVEKTGVNPLIGEDDKRMSGVNLINCRPPLNNTEANRHPIFDLKTENFSLLSHIRNLTMNQSNLDTPLFGIQTEKVKKPTDYSEAGDDDDDDEIRMLYDEQTSTTTIQSDEKQQTVSFSWYRLTDNAPRTFSLQNRWGIGKLNTPPNVKRIPGLEFSGSSRAKPWLENDEYLMEHEPRNVNYTSMENERTFKRSARGEISSHDHEYGGIRLEKYGIPLPMVKLDGHNENEHMDNNDREGEPRDQWDALDEDLKSEMNVNGKDAAWRTRNRKREADYCDHQTNDEQGYYRLSVGGSSFGNPTNLIMSAFRAKSNKPRGREYYEDIPEERIREQMRPNVIAPSNYPN